VMATVHRAENTDDPARLRAIAGALAQAGEALGCVVLALHPRTRKMLADHGIALDAKVRVIEPAPYLEMIALLAGARAVMTDSGGVQKEAFFLQVPCLTLRDETEWVETVDSDANRLIGIDPTAFTSALDELLSGRWRPDFARRPYGDGNAADAIVASLVRGMDNKAPTTSGMET
jgi:UDP-GlcNAc3NAcA epimerase